MKQTKNLRIFFLTIAVHRLVCAILAIMPIPVWILSIVLPSLQTMNSLLSSIQPITVIPIPHIWYFIEEIFLQWPTAYFPECIRYIQRNKTRIRMNNMLSNMFTKYETRKFGITITYRFRNVKEKNSSNSAKDEMRRLNINENNE